MCKWRVVSIIQISGFSYFRKSNFLQNENIFHQVTKKIHHRKQINSFHLNCIFVFMSFSDLCQTPQEQISSFEICCLTNLIENMHFLSETLTSGWQCKLCIVNIMYCVTYTKVNTVHIKQNQLLFLKVPMFPLKQAVRKSLVMDPDWLNVGNVPSACS